MITASISPFHHHNLERAKVRVITLNVWNIQASDWNHAESKLETFGSVKRSIIKEDLRNGF